MKFYTFSKHYSFGIITICWKSGLRKLIWSMLDIIWVFVQTKVRWAKLRVSISFMRLLVLGCLGRLFRLSYEDSSSGSQNQATILTSKLKPHLAPDCYLYHTENILSSHRHYPSRCLFLAVKYFLLGEIFSYLDTSVHLLHSQGNMCTHSFQCCWCSERRHHRVWKYFRFRISKIFVTTAGAHLYLHSFSSGIEHPLPPQPSLQ